VSADFFQINLGTLLGTLIVPFISAVIGGLLTSQFAFRRYKKEWWWQRKADAYSQLVAALYEAKQFSESHFLALEKGRDVPDDRDKELRAKWKVAKEAIDRARDTGIFFLNEEAVKRLETYELDQSKASSA
jgi:hypothetical protein